MLIGFNDIQSELKMIDQRVYDLYNLTPDEIILVEESIK